MGAHNDRVATVDRHWTSGPRKWLLVYVTMEQYSAMEQVAVLRDNLLPVGVTFAADIRTAHGYVKVVRPGVSGH